MTKAVPLRQSDSLQTGEHVYAIGAPQGLDLTISEGLVSGLRILVADGEPFVYLLRKGREARSFGMKRLAAAPDPERQTLGRRWLSYPASHRVMRASR